MRELSQAGLACRSTFFHNSLFFHTLRSPKRTYVSLRCRCLSVGLNVRKGWIPDLRRGPLERQGCAVTSHSDPFDIPK
jgi:hypothetical protein